MLKVINARIAQGKRTVNYPGEAPVLPDRFRGMPWLSPALCGSGCDTCQSAGVCPTGAIGKGVKGPAIDLGRCIFCGSCERACSLGAVKFTNDHQLAARDRGDLVIDGAMTFRHANAMKADLLKIFGRSLRLRQVSAGGCNACEADVNVLNTVVFDLSRFGIQFVASPRHADGLLVTGPGTKNMELALRKTWEATPAPKFVIASGACAISGGLFAGHPETCRGADEVLPVDLFIPGCPPHPFTVLDGLLRLVGKVS